MGDFLIKISGNAEDDQTYNQAYRDYIDDANGDLVRFVRDGEDLLYRSFMIYTAGNTIVKQKIIKDMLGSSIKIGV